MSNKLLIAVGVFVAAAPFAASAQGAAPIKGDAEAARDKVSMCVGCHQIAGYKSSFPSVYSVPKIVGQSSKYIEAALNEYRKGGRNHPTMTSVAKGLSDQDIADLAAYYGSK